LQVLAEEKQRPHQAKELTQPALAPLKERYLKSAAAASGFQSDSTHPINHPKDDCPSKRNPHQTISTTPFASTDNSKDERQ
jgi:hypothetical protein